MSGGIQGVRGGTGWAQAPELDEPSQTPAQAREARRAQAVSSGGGLSLQPVYEDGQVNVVSDEPLSSAQARALAQRIEAAYAYDAAEQRWRDGGPLHTPLTVAVLSAQAFARVTGDASGSTAGVTAGPNLFVVPDSVLGRRQPQAEDTIAHELSHVQDFREAGPRLASVPIYLQEGKAYLLGDRYPQKEGLGNPHVAYVAQQLGALTARDAAAVMTHFREPQDETPGAFGFIGEVTGSLYVEFLRTRLGGTGFPDALERVADTVAAVGRGVSYEQAFVQRFGLPPADAERAFVRYIGETEGRPDERLRGTVYASARRTSAA
ncbi:hypothetical protein FGE12_03125 [Aggregicoccus sp. 17bor-14]|uniref:hypothetical protein n=1 Tax=Myxococcaceae TaxID=31 RepID=UPI00129CFECD|nr:MULTISPECIES: hypothetical protein [Myxococcaceae]MBF5041365.1 hypothetical protein [Simulacricoccus sp. 17bor-14]MRI87149.1 hypothetical protein [Aggregicoccus sp. 17bor-14]